MPTTRQVYRLRVFDTNGVDPLLTVTSLPEGYYAPGSGPGAHPYIAAAPEVEGTAVDPITGKVTDGSALVRVIDARITAVPVRLGWDGFEDYAQAPVDIIPFASRWTTVGSLGTQIVKVDASSPILNDGVQYLGITLGETPPGLASAYVERTFTGLPANMDVQVRAWMRPTLIGGNWGAEGGVDPQCGMRVIGADGMTEEVYDHEAFDYLGGGTWPHGTDGELYVKRQLRVANRTTADGEITVRLGCFDYDDAGGVNHRNFIFDLVEIWPITEDGDGRIVTRVLTDDDARQHLLGRRALVEMADLDDCARDYATGRWYFPDEIPEGVLGSPNPDAVTVLQAGFVTALKLPRALVWDITVGDSPRPRHKVKVYEGTELPIGANWAALSIPSCVIGGPVRSPWPSATAPGAACVCSWRVEVTGVASPIVSVKVLTATVPPDVRAARNATSAADQFREAMALADELAKPFYESFYGFPPHPGITPFTPPYGWFPRLRAELHDTTGATAGGTPSGTIAATAIPLSVETVTIGIGGAFSFASADQAIANVGAMLLYWPTEEGSGMPAAPAVGTQFDLIVYALDVTARTPRLIAGHVSDILADAWDAVGETYDQDSLDAFATLVPWARVALRFPAPPTLAALESEIVGGPFGVGIGRDDQGRKTVFSTRVRPETAAGTITDADLRNASTAVFDHAVSTAIAGVDYEFERYRVWTDRDGERPADGLVAGKYTAAGDGPAVGPLAPLPGVDTRQVFKVPGFPIDAAGLAVDPVGFANGQAEPILERRGRGAVYSELDVLPSADYALGAEVNVEVSHKPGALVGDSPTSQRGTARAMQVVRRSWVPAGFRYRLEEVGAASAVGPGESETPEVPILPAPVLTLAVDPTAPTTTAIATVTNAADLAALGALVTIEYVVSATEPASNAGAVVTPPVITNESPATATLGPVAAGSKLWARATPIDVRGIELAAAGAWVSVQLVASQDGTSGLVAPALQPFVESTTGTLNVEIRHATATGIRIATSTTGPVDVAAVRAATLVPFSATATLGTGITPTAGQRFWVAAYAYDDAGNESALGTAQYVEGAIAGGGGGTTGVTLIDDDGDYLADDNGNLLGE